MVFDASPIAPLVSTVLQVLAPHGTTVYRVLVPRGAVRVVPKNASSIRAARGGFRVLRLVVWLRALVIQYTGGAVRPPVTLLDIARSRSGVARCCHGEGPSARRLYRFVLQFASMEFLKSR